MNIGANLQRARRRKELSQEDVAQALNVSRQCVSLWENDQTQPTLDNLDQLCQLYGLSGAVLLGQIPFPEDMTLPPQMSKEESERRQQAEQEQAKRTGKVLTMVSLIECIVLVFAFVLPGVNFLLDISGMVLAIVGYRMCKAKKAVVLIVFFAVYFIACIVAMQTQIWRHLI